MRRPWLDTLRQIFRGGFGPAPGLSSPGGLTPPSQDTRAAIDELARAVRNNPDSVEIYLALGNLYRSQGDIERAVTLRSNLLGRSGIDPKLAAKASFELGRDFRRAGFMDRAAQALEQARRVLGDDPGVLGELARVAADVGDYATAAELSQRLGRHQAQAHYLVMQARELDREPAQSHQAESERLVRRALEVFPGSVEAWVYTLEAMLPAAPPEDIRQAMGRSLAAVPPQLKFLLLEMLLTPLTKACCPEETAPGKPSPAEAARGRELLDAVLSLLAADPPEVLLHYAAARLLVACGQKDRARQWLEKTIAMGPEFWPARLDLLHLARADHPLTGGSGAFAEQLDFFVNRARQVKRFVCAACGLKTGEPFYVCPRCHSWHAVRYRMHLTE